MGLPPRLKPLITDAVMHLPQEHRRAAALFGLHGVGSRWEVVRELLSNAIDASLASQPAMPPHVDIRLYKTWMEVADRGGGIYGDTDRLKFLLLTPGVSTKEGDRHAIGRMGIGFLSALTGMTAVQVVTRTDPGKGCASLCLGEPPWADEAEPTAPGTIIRAALMEELPSVQALRAFIAHRFPFTPVEVRVDGRPAQPRSSPWSKGSTAKDWRSWAREGLDLPLAAWTERRVFAWGKVLAWALRTADPRGGQAVILQRGALLEDKMPLPATPSGIPAPPWLLMVVDTEVALPLLTRSAVAAGEGRCQLQDGLASYLESLLERPASRLLDQVARLQEGHSHRWSRWCAALPLNNPFRLASVWETSLDDHPLALRTLCAYKGLVTILLGDSDNTELFWQDCRRRKEPNHAYVRARDEASGEILRQSLADRDVRALTASTGAAARTRLELEPSTARLVDAMARHLEQHRVTVEFLTMSSPSLLGVIEKPAQTSWSPLRRMEVQPSLQRQRTLYLNLTGESIRQLAGRRRPLSADEAALLLGCVAAQTTLGSEMAHVVGCSLARLLGDKPADPLREKAPGAHARVLVAASSRRAGLFAATRSVLEHDPYFVQVLGLGKWRDVPDGWRRVAVKIRRADAYLFDVRDLDPSVFLALGYFLARARKRPHLILAQPGQPVASLEGLAVVRVPKDSDPGEQELRKMFHRQGFTAQGFLATWPFLSLRHLPKNLRARVPSLRNLNLLEFANGAHALPTDLWQREAQRLFRERLERFAEVRFPHHPTRRRT